MHLKLVTWSNSEVCSDELPLDPDTAFTGSSVFSLHVAYSKAQVDTMLDMHTNGQADAISMVRGNRG